MKKRSNQLIVSAVVSMFLIPSLSARAVTPAENFYLYNSGSNTAFSAISSTDLLENGSTALSGVSFSKTASTNLVTTLNSGINDGLSVVNAFGDSTYYGYNDAANGGTAKSALIDNNALAGGATITFNLNTSASPLGYTINGINTIAGWGDHASVADQNYTLSYSTVANPSLFINLSTVTYNPNDPINDNSGGGGVATEVSFTSLDLVGVAALKFNFTADPTSAGYGNSATGIWLQEIDATGVATVPEPGTWAMMIVGAAGVVVLSLRRLVRA
jgi:hypothetical protein